MEDQEYMDLKKYIMHGFSEVERWALQLSLGLACTFNQKMLAMESKWNGVLVEWNASGDTFKESLIWWSTNLPLHSNLLHSWPTSSIEGGICTRKMRLQGPKTWELTMGRGLLDSIDGHFCYFSTCSISSCMVCWSEVDHFSRLTGGSTAGRGNQGL